MARFIEIHPVDPQPRAIRQAIDIVRGGGLIAFPTDCAYALGGQLGNLEVKNRITSIRGLSDKHHFTLMCGDFAQAGQFVRLDNPVFRAVKAATPGPYTFILPATHDVPRKLMHPKKRTVGVRIANNRVVSALLAELGEPMLTSTLLLPGAQEPATQGWLIKDELDHQLDAVIDSGDCGTELTTVIDYSEDEPVVIRLGAGDPTPFE